MTRLNHPLIHDGSSPSSSRVSMPNGWTAPVRWVGKKSKSAEGLSHPPPEPQVIGGIAGHAHRAAQRVQPHRPQQQGGDAQVERRFADARPSRSVEAEPVVLGDALGLAIDARFGAAIGRGRGRGLGPTGSNPDDDRDGGGRHDDPHQGDADHPVAGERPVATDQRVDDQPECTGRRDPDEHEEGPGDQEGERPEDPSEGPARPIGDPGEEGPGRRHDRLCSRWRGHRPSSPAGGRSVNQG